MVDPSADETIKGAPADDASYCARLIEEGDPDLHLTLPYLPDADRPKWRAAFALHLELRRVPNAASEPPLGEIRLQWWRDALGEIRNGAAPRAHPVVQELARARIASDEFLRAADDGTDARARLLYGEPFSTLDDLVGFLAAAEGWIAPAMIGEGVVPTAWRQVIAAYGLARWGEGLAPSIPREDIAARARALVADHGPAAMASEIGIAPFLFTALVEGYLRRPAGAPWPLKKRLTLFGAMLRGRL